MLTLNRKRAHELVSTLTFPTKAFIDGAFCDSISGDVFETINPATGGVITQVAQCGVADIDMAVAAARRVFETGTWSRAAPETRKVTLLRLAELVRENAELLAVMESLDSGKTISDCIREIATEVPNIIQWYAELSDKMFGKIAATGESNLGLVIKEPAGVAGLVVPWNFPLLIVALKLGPALAAGCSVVLKPAEQTPLTALKFAELAAEAGIPDGVLNVVPGFGETAGQMIGRHRDIDVVSFTGSTEVGGLFLRYAGESNLKTVGLELGGKSPFIVLSDAKIDDNLVQHAVMAAFWNAGQNCSANMRQIVDISIADEYTSRVSERAKSFRVGDPLDPETQIGAMISKEHQDRVMAYIDSGVTEGARMMTGGKLENVSGYFIQPTVFADVRPKMKIAREEIFGPVLGVTTASGFEEAINLARDTDYGLHATVFTRDIDRAIHAARRLPCGTVAINGFSEGDIKTPFGGYKRSGSTARDMGVEAFDQYLQTKTIWISVGSAA